MEFLEKYRNHPNFKEACQVAGQIIEDNYKIVTVPAGSVRFKEIPGNDRVVDIEYNLKQDK